MRAGGLLELGSGHGSIAMLAGGLLELGSGHGSSATGTLGSASLDETITCLAENEEISLAFAGKTVLIPIKRAMVKNADRMESDPPVGRIFGV
jgi:hypothetical protein